MQHSEENLNFDLLTSTGVCVRVTKFTWYISANFYFLQEIFKLHRTRVIGTKMYEIYKMQCSSLDLTRTIDILSRALLIRYCIKFLRFFHFHNDVQTTAKARILLPSASNSKAENCWKYKQCVVNRAAENSGWNDRFVAQQGLPVSQI